MKKLLLIASSLFIGLSGINAQSSIEMHNNATGGLILNNDIILEDVLAGGQSHLYVGVKNIGTSTKTYGLYRTDVVLNPGTDLGAAAYFCFGGQCFPNTTYTAPATNYVTLTAGQTDVPTQIYLDEDALTAGYSEVRYTVYDVNNVNDNVSFTFKYNSTLASVKNNANLFASISDVYPNPSVNKAQININSKATVNATISITNALGSIVSTKNIELSSGKNNIQLDSENLNSGIYFATITSSNNKVVKKFTVNK